MNQTPSFRFSGIKAFAEPQEIDLRPITLIFGRNSAGKSTLIQSLLLLKQTVQETDLVQPSLVVNGTQTQLGSFRNLVHRHEKQRSVEVGGTWTGRSGDRRDVARELHSAGATLRFKHGRSEVKLNGGEWHWNYGSGECRIPFDVRARAKPDPTQSQQRLTFSNEDDARAQLRAFFQAVARDASEKGIWTGPLHRFERDVRRSAEFSDDDRAAMLEALPSVADDLRLRNLPVARRFGAQEGFSLAPDLDDVFRTNRASLSTSTIGQLQPVAPEIGFAMRVMGQAIRAADTAMLRLAASVTYIGPYRQPPERLVLLTGEQVAGVGIQGENTIGLLARSPDLRLEVDGWLERLGIPYELAIDRLESTKATLGDVLVAGLVERESRTPVGIRDVGFGVSQVLPLIVQAVVRDTGTLVIEQPELHVHPRLQAQLGDLFADQANAGRRFVLETHSEHLILRLLRKVRNGELDPEDLSVLYVDRSSSSTSRVTRLRVDEDGEFVDRWPEGFFAERREELLG